ncbi:hypothetical protein GCM10020256_61900 [Streptomyces thermocoprophilus]
MLLAHGRGQVAATRVEELYALLVEAGPVGGEETGSGTAPLAVSGEMRMVPGGTLWHRADCPPGRGEGGGAARRREAAARWRAERVPDL